MGDGNVAKGTSHCSVFKQKLFSQKKIMAAMNASAKAKKKKMAAMNPSAKAKKKIMRVTNPNP